MGDDEDHSIWQEQLLYFPILKLLHSRKRQKSRAYINTVPRCSSFFSLRKTLGSCKRKFMSHLIHVYCRFSECKSFLNYWNQRFIVNLQWVVKWLCLPIENTPVVPETRDGLSSWTQDCLSVGLFLMRRGKAESPFVLERTLWAHQNLRFVVWAFRCICRAD